MAGESWKSHKNTGREAAWDRDHSDQLLDLAIEREELAAEALDALDPYAGCECGLCLAHADYLYEAYGVGV